VDELLAAAVISVMLASGRALEDWAAYRARHDLSALLARAPRTTRRYRNGSLETVPLDQVVPGDLLLVAAGDVVPVDGTLVAAAAVLDESALTGEALPVQHAGATRCAAAPSTRPGRSTCGPRRTRPTAPMRASSAWSARRRRRRRRSSGSPIGTPCGSCR
jgi:cation transport ATPase